MFYTHMNNKIKIHIPFVWKKNSFTDKELYSFLSKVQTLVKPEIKSCYKTSSPKLKWTYLEWQVGLCLCECVYVCLGGVGAL